MFKVFFKITYIHLTFTNNIFYGGVDLLKAIKMYKVLLAFLYQQ